MDHERFCGSRVQRADGEEVEQHEKTFARSNACRCTLVAVVPAHGQRGGRGGPPPTAQADAPFDLTGYWVSVITQNWRLRMVVPGRGDYIGIPLNEASKKIADAWDPAKDEAAGDQCKGYSAAIIMTHAGASARHLAGPQHDAHGNRCRHADAGVPFRQLEVTRRPVNLAGRFGGDMVRPAATGGPERAEGAQSEGRHDEPAPWVSS